MSLKSHPFWVTMLFSGKPSSYESVFFGAFYENQNLKKLKISCKADNAKYINMLKCKKIWEF